MIHRHAVGVEITSHILVPQFDAFILRIHGDARHQPLAHRTEIKIEAVPLAAFYLRGQLVEPEFITPLHELIHLHHEQLLGQQTAPARKALTGAIYIPHRRANMKIIVRQAIMRPSPPHRVFLGDAGTKTVPCQANQERMYVAPR